MSGYYTTTETHTVTFPQLNEAWLATIKELVAQHTKIVEVNEKIVAALAAPAVALIDERSLNADG